MKLLNASQVAEILGVSVEWVRDHASGRREPRLPAVKLGDLWKFIPQDVENFIREQRTV